MKLLGFAGTTRPDLGQLDWQQYLTRLGSTPYTPEFANTPFSYAVTGSSVASDSGLVAILSGQAYWNNAGGHLKPAPPAETLLRAYRQFDDDFLNHIQGGFSLALIDSKKGRVILAIDRMGIERMTYTVHDGAIGFATSAESLAHSPLCKFNISQQALYDFLLMHMIPAPNTIYQGVHKLRPGTAAFFEQGRLAIHRYWRPSFAESSREGQFSEWQHDLLQGLQNAVEDCSPDEHTGSFLSGGLDSSTVTGMLAKVSRTPARTFSMGFGVDAYDELNYARIASKHFNCNPFEYHVTPEDVVSAFPLIAKAYDEPFGNSSAVPTYLCALRAREQGINHLLAGDGGDEIFGGNERYVKQRVFELYQRIPYTWRRHLIEPVSKIIPTESGFMPLRKLRSYVDQAKIPLPERLESWNFIYRNGTETMLDPEFANSINPRAPIEIMDEVYRSAPSNTMLHQMLYYDWHFTLSDNDLRKVGTMCELAGVKVSYPMLDQRVIDLSIKIPPNKKIEGMALRSFYKKAVTGFLPNEIINKPKHGFGLPFGVWLKTHEPLKELIYTHLHDLKKRHIVRNNFIDSIIKEHQEGHASYFGYAIWDLAMLEAWLKIHSR